MSATPLRRMGLPTRVRAHSSSSRLNGQEARSWGPHPTLSARAPATTLSRVLMLSSPGHSQHRPHSIPRERIGSELVRFWQRRQLEILSHRPFCRHNPSWTAQSCFDIEPDHCHPAPLIACRALPLSRAAAIASSLIVAATSRFKTRFLLVLRPAVYCASLSQPVSSSMDAFSAL